MLEEVIEILHKGEQILLIWNRNNFRQAELRSWWFTRNKIRVMSFLKYVNIICQISDNEPIELLCEMNFQIMMGITMMININA